MNGRTIRIALGQILVEAKRPDANMGRALAAIDQAADAGLEVLVLPETLDLGWDCEEAAIGAEAIHGPRAAALSARAAAAGIIVAAGLAECAAGTVRNTATLIDRDGSVVGYRRKVNELQFARMVYAPGNRMKVRYVARTGRTCDLRRPAGSAARCRFGPTWRLICSLTFRVGSASGV